MIKISEESFYKQGFMKTLGAKLLSIEKGIVKIECPWHQSLTQQHGYFHAGVLTSIVDVACGYAAHSMMPEGSDVLSVEFKTNFLKVAKTDKIVAHGKVVKSGKTLTFCEGKVTDESEKILFATMQATMICIKPNY